MRKSHVFALLLALLPCASLAQSPFPQTLPPNTVVGRLGAGQSGPAQAIPFATLAAQIFNLGPISSVNVPIVYNGTGLVGSTKSGNTTDFATVSGSIASGHCVSVDNNGNLIDEGASCISSSSGVNAGTVGQFAYYASSGSIVSGATSGTAGDVVTFSSSGPADSLVNITNAGSGGNALIETWPANQYNNGPLVCMICTLPAQGTSPATDLNHSTLYGRNLSVSGSNAGGRYLFGDSLTSEGHVNVMVGLGGTCAGDSCIMVTPSSSSTGSGGDIILGTGGDSGTGGNSVIIGPSTPAGPSGGNSSGVVIGNAASGLGTQDIAIGGSSSTPSAGFRNIAIGNNASVATGSNTQSTVVGYNASATGGSASVVGQSATADSNSTALGTGTTAQGGSSIAIGNGASAPVTSTTAIGTNAAITGGSSFYSIAIGNGATATATGHAVIGGSHITQFYAGTESGGASTHSDAHYMTGVAFASLPSAAAGEISYITDGKAANCGDSACTTWGTTVTAGGGALKLLLWNNGANWTLVGK